MLLSQASTTKAAQADHVQHAARRVDKHAGLMRTSIVSARRLSCEHCHMA